MTIGSFGKVTFRVSSKKVETFQKMKLSTTASYAQHKVHGQKAIQEFTGFDAEKLTFDMQLSALLGINPKKELDKLNKMLRSKESYTLVLGTKVIGKRWVLTNISNEFGVIYKDGTLFTCKVSVTLSGTE